MASSAPRPAQKQNQLHLNGPIELSVKKPKGLRVFRRLEWILDPVTYLERTKAHAPDFFEEDSLGFFGTGPLVIVSHPEAMQYILSRDRKTFSAPGEFNRLLEPVIGSASVIMLSGDRHKERRQLITPAFHGERLNVYGQLICELTQAAAQTLQPGQTFRARDLAQQVSLQIIFKVVFGLTDSPRSKEIMAVLTQTVDIFGSPTAALMLFFNSLQKNLGKWSPWGKFLQHRADLDKLVYAEIRDRQAHLDPNRTDILSMLMSARTESGEALNEHELRDELMALLMAGHETTATSIAWALYWIHKEPSVKDKLLAELDQLSVELGGELGGELGESATPTQIAQLPYLSAVCQETLRRSPVAMFTFPRVSQAPVTLMGHRFEPGTTFLGSIFLTHQREDLYPDAQAFRPERFLEGQFSPYEFIPFGNGARRCVGAALAQYELKLAIVTLLSHYQFHLADSRPERPRRRGVTLAPGRGVPMVFEGPRVRRPKNHSKDQ
jgi:cytochrome P450 family 110